MMGTPEAIICHTISSRVVDRLFINGRETGEFGLNADLAGWHGVPSVFISGDAAVAAEAKSFVPEINTTIVKWGVSRYAARCLHPKRARALIKRGAKAALANAAKHQAVQGGRARGGEDQVRVFNTGGGFINTVFCRDARRKDDKSHF